MKRNDNQFMEMALTLAAKGRGQTSPNPMVGAVIVKQGKIVGEAWHRRAGSDHAEVIALKQAGKKAQGATLYVTLEPCAHYGQTPPCVDAVIEAGIKEIVIAMKDPNPLTNGKSIQKLKRKGLRVRTGVLENEARELNEIFIKFKTSNKPFVAAKTAQTLDGKIATVSGRSKWITSVKTRVLARKIRDEFDAILVGINTVIEDNPRLNGFSRKKRLKKIVLDSSLRIKLTANLFKGVKKDDCIIATTAKASKTKIKQLERKGARIIICPSNKNGIRMKWLFRKLAEEKITSVLIEGGSKMVGGALAEKCVDKLYIYIAPLIFGSHSALGSIDGLRIKDVKKAILLEKRTIFKVDRDLLITGYPRY